MRTTDIDTIDGHRIVAVCGLVTGSAVETLSSEPVPGVGSMAQLRDDLEALDRARDAAREVLVGAAEELGADAVVGLRFETTALGTDAIEVIASGTAVRVIRSVDGVAGSPSPGEGYSPA